ncbi:hypothetical protein UlMin_010562 [Ulmus minor]
MNLVGAKFEPIKSALYGFTGDSVSSEGVLNLPMELGTHPCQHIQSVNFVVVDCPSSYNAIIGRPTLNAIRAVTSTYHLLVKFPTVGGIGVLKGDQQESRDIYEAANRPSNVHRVNIIETPGGGVATRPPATIMIGNIEVKLNQVRKFDELDPREPSMEQHGEPVEELEEIPLFEDDLTKTYKIGSSLTGQLPTDLINFLRATYQRLVNKMFKQQIGKTMEVYVDDMLVKSLKADEHINNLRESFEVLREYKMKLNPAKCAFGVTLGKFLGFMVNHRGIEANPAKIQALLNMESPRKVKEVQSLTGRVAALNRFISRATDKCQPFFRALRKGKDFSWTAECEQSFQELKTYLGRPPLLSKPQEGELLILYLAVSKGAVSSALIREEEGVQWPIYYTSKSLLDAETRYPEVEKLALALMIAARKLRPYFQAHTIIVPTKFPLKQILQKPDTSGRLAKWSIELGEFDILFKPPEFTYQPTSLESAKELVPSPSSLWHLYVDGSSTDNCSGAGVILVSPEKMRLSCALHFRFKATNNQAEYEALLAGLRLAKEVSARHLLIYSDSQLIVNQVNSEYQAKGEKMASYLEKAKELLGQFDTVTITQIPRNENTNADALARLATGLEDSLLKTVPLEILVEPSIDKHQQVDAISDKPTWMDPIVAYLRDGTLPQDKFEAHKDKLRKRSFSSPSLTCLNEDQAKYVLQEVHEGVCGNHSSGRALAHKVLRQGYYWPTIQADSLAFVQKCDKYQRFSTIPHQPPEELTPVSSPWPFAKWGIDLIGPLPTARGQLKYAVVTIDYYTKWVEAEALAKITEQNVTNFIWKHIICRFGIPRELVSDHGTQFENERLRSTCRNLGITKIFSSPTHPKSNGQVEAVNKTIKYTLKKKLEKSKGA